MGRSGAQVKRAGHTVERSEPVTPIAGTGIETRPDGKVGIRASRHVPRPKPTVVPRIALPWGYRMLVHGRTEWDDAVAEKFVEAYYHAGGSLLVACKVTGVAYPAAVRWRAERPEFRTALAECDALVRDVVHQQFMAKVLSGDERNPAWKLAYFKKHFPEYVQPAASPQVQITVVDTTIRPLAPATLAIEAGSPEVAAWQAETRCTADAGST